MKKFGYARVSSNDQRLDLQLDALNNVGCDKIFSEKMSATKDRPQLEAMNSQLRSGDVVVVWKLDRLGRSLRQLVNLVNWYREIGVEFISINDNIDTTSAQGRLTFNLFASFAEFEREIISERTRAGLQAAKKKGRVGGRKTGLSKPNQLKAFAILQMLKDESKSVADIQRELGLAKVTYYRYKAWAEAQGKQ